MRLEHFLVQVGDFAGLGVHGRLPLQLARGDNRCGPLRQLQWLTIAPLLDLREVRHLIQLVLFLPRVEPTFCPLAVADKVLVALLLLQRWLHAFVGAMIELLRDWSFQRYFQIMLLLCQLVVIIFVLLLE